MSSVLDRRLALLRWHYDGLAGADLMAAMVRHEFAGRIALVSSFGAESAVLLHMAATIDPKLDVVFVDTGKLFGETKRYRDQLIDRLKLRSVKTVTPLPQALSAEHPKGVLWSRNADASCHIRKVEPLTRALAPYDAWINGRKAYQSGTRAHLEPIETVDGRFKINPLAGWSRAQIEAYFTAHELPPHPLVADGYLSIGCMPCTTRVAPGEDPRAGRWRGSDKNECGIHVATSQVAA